MPRVPGRANEFGKLHRGNEQREPAARACAPMQPVSPPARGVTLLSLWPQAKNTDQTTADGHATCRHRGDGDATPCTEWPATGDATAPASSPAPTSAPASSNAGPASSLPPPLVPRRRRPIHCTSRHSRRRMPLPLDRGPDERGGPHQQGGFRNTPADRATDARAAAAARRRR